MRGNCCTCGHVNIRMLRDTVGGRNRLIQRHFSDTGRCAECRCNGYEEMRRELSDLLDAAREGPSLYRKADDCQITKPHSLGEHGKPCQECGAEQIWVHPATKEKQ